MAEHSGFTSLQRAATTVTVAVAMLGVLVGAAGAGFDERTVAQEALTAEVEYRGSSPGFGMIVKTDDSEAFTGLEHFTTMPGMLVRYVVSSSATEDQSILITLSAENSCAQDPMAAAWCWVRMLVDGTPVPPGQVIFNGVEHAANAATANAWATHTMQWVAGPLGPGVHLIRVQWRVDEPNATFGVDNRTLSVMGFRHNSVTTTP